MTFRKHWISGKVVSSEGYSVKPVGGTTLLYQDENNCLYVGADRLGPNSWAIFAEDMRKGSEHGRQLHDDRLRALVVERIREVMEFLGGSLEM